MDELAEKGRARSTRTVRMILTSIFISLVFMAGAVYLTGRDCSDVHGRVAVTGQAPGATSIEFSPTECRSGEREGFFGVVVRDPDGGMVVLVDQPDQDPLVRLVLPGGGPELILRSEACSVFILVVRDTDTKVQNITWRRGRLHLECELDKGTTVEAQLEFAACG